jgi:hypothetical protein
MDKWKHVMLPVRLNGAVYACFKSYSEATVAEALEATTSGTPFPKHGG